MVGAIRDLTALREQGDASVSTEILLRTLQSPTNAAYVAAANAVNFLLLIGAFAFLFFWKPPHGDEAREAPRLT